MRYYITNGSQYIGVNGDVVENPELAKHFTYNEAQTYLSKELRGDTKWAFKRYFTSGGRYAMTTSTLYITSRGNVTKDINTAKAFRSPADAVNYIKNNRTVLGYIPTPVIINSNHEFVCKPEIKMFTQEQLDVVGADKTTPRIKIARSAKKEIALKSRGICPICGLPMTDKDSDFDHIIPLSRGGSNDPSNIRMVHKSCNKFKNNYLDKEMYTMISRIGAKRVYEEPESDETLDIVRAYLRGRLNWLKGETGWENTDSE